MMVIWGTPVGIILSDHQDFAYPINWYIIIPYSIGMLIFSVLFFTRQIITPHIRTTGTFILASLELATAILSFIGLLSYGAFFLTISNPQVATSLGASYVDYLALVLFFSGSFIGGTIVLGYDGFARLRGLRVLINRNQSSVATPMVSIGGKSFASSGLYRREDLPNTDEILPNAKHSVYFAGDSLFGVTDGYAPTLRKFAGKVKMRFLLVDPSSKMGEALVADSDHEKDIKGKTERSLSTLVNIRTKSLPDERRDEFDIRIHKGIPFSMVLVDSDDKDKNGACILIGYYSYGSPPSHRPCALIGSDSESYNTLLENFHMAWEHGRDGILEQNPKPQLPTNEPSSSQQPSSSGKTLQFDLETNSDWAQITYGSWLKLEGDVASELLAGVINKKDSNDRMFHINKQGSKSETTRVLVKGRFSVLARRPRIQLTNGHDGESKLTVYDTDSHIEIGSAFTDAQIHEKEVVLQLEL